MKPLNVFAIFGLSAKLDIIILMLKRIEGKEDKIMYDMTAVNEAMDTMATAIQDIIAEVQKLISGETNTVDPAVMQALADKLKAGAASLEEAKAAAEAAPVA